MDNITDSVGKNGVNTSTDVALIQQLLNYNTVHSFYSAKKLV